MKMNGITSELATWLSKYTRESWKYDADSVTVSIVGNMTITDMHIQELPVNFSSVEGKFKCRNCSNLKSVKGFPTSATEISFENCLFTEEIYMGALQDGTGLEEYLRKNFSSLTEETIADIEKHFPDLYESQRGQRIGIKFGF
jgi:hypothetical protein